MGLDDRLLARTQAVVPVVELELDEEEDDGDDGPQHRRQRQTQIRQAVPQDVELGGEDRPQVVPEQPDLQDGREDPALHLSERGLVGRDPVHEEDEDAASQGDGRQADDRRQAAKGE